MVDNDKDNNSNNKNEDDNEEDNDNSKNDYDDKGIPALRLDRDLGFLRGYQGHQPQ